MKRISEPDTWESGRCCDTSQLYKLEGNDKLEAMETIEDASEDRREIPRGSKCRFLRWDDDGDLVLRYNGLIHTVFMHGSDELSML